MLKTWTGLPVYRKHDDGLIMSHEMLWFAYIGPDTMVPLASALAAIGGAVLLFWRYLVLACKKAFRFVRRRSE